MLLLPKKEVIEGTLRVNVSYPEVIIRELVANALVHQDFYLENGRVLIEIFSDRIEISNPGQPLLSDYNKLIDTVSSRNELIADSLKIMRICEKRGSGIDRVFDHIRLKKMPAPKMFGDENVFKVTVYGYKKIEDYTKSEKREVCFNHCLVKFFVDKEPMTNSSLSERLNISKGNTSITSRIIKDAVDVGLIKQFDPENTSRKTKKYVPYWIK